MTIGQSPVGTAFRVQPGGAGQKPLVEVRRQPHAIDVPVEHLDDNVAQRSLRHWILPASWFAIALFCQSVGLHIATYYYIVWMDRLRGETAAIEVALEQDDVANKEQLSADLREGSLHDVVADYLGYHDIPMQAMDALSLLIPVTWACLVLWRRDLHCWTKCMLCGSLLALGKGVLAWVTVVPDSIGWKGCQERLGKHGLDFFREEGKLNFEQRFLGTLRDIVANEMVGFEGRRFRFCADMVYSGHTYFVALFGLGTWDLVCHMTEALKREKRIKCWAIRAAVGTVLSCTVALDVILILMNRFHYTMDVMLALFLVLLVHTNGVIAIFVRWWCDTGSPLELEEETMIIPPCCFPFCWLQGRYSVVVRSKVAGDSRGTQVEAGNNLAENGHQYNRLKPTQED